MKIGKLYEDKFTGELYMLDNFTLASTTWVNIDGNRVCIDKWTGYDFIKTTACKDKNKIKEFFDKFNYNVIGLCPKCNKWYASKFSKHVMDVIPSGEKTKCDICNTKLLY